jgi:DNA-binding transcriptional ArsR family regulator
MITTFTALAEPNRLHIVEYLREKPHSVNEIVMQLHLSQPLVSKHLRVLSQAGLVKVHSNAQQRIYQLEGRPFENLNSWLETFHRVWNERLDTLDDYMQELKEQQKQEKDSGKQESDQNPYS